MIRILFVLLGSLIVLACNSTDPGPSLQLDVDGVAREYRLFVPANSPDGPMPLVLAFHGGGGRDEDYPEQSAFEALAESQGFAIAYPLAELLEGNEGEWQLNTADDSRQDLEYVEALIDEISSQHSIAAERVYATGYSLGSMFTYELVCHLSTRFAAVASHAGSMPVTPNSCLPEPVGVMHLHGTLDGIIPYGESWDWKEWPEVGTMMPVPDLIQFWADQFTCADSSETALPDSAHFVHDGCNGGVRVEHYRLEGAGHEWPLGIQGSSAHEVIWSFLQEFSR